jgi:hypothetical protein
MTRMGKAHAGRPVLGAKRLLVGFAVSLAALALAAPAMATKPTGDFINFGDCPTKVSGVNFCVFGQSSSGEFKIKSTTVPITKTITLQGGIIENLETGAETFVNATDGNTLSKTPETVPGGLLKIIAPEFFPEPLKKIFNEFINKGITGVSAVAELVGTPTINRSKLFSGEGAGFVLPVRVKLENEFLGSKCFVGSKAHPVNIELTTGTTSPPLPNLPITGELGEIEFKDEVTLLILRKNSLVNNSFAAPEAEGCGSQILFGLFTGIIDGAVDLQLGLPSAAGNNTAILNGTLENAIASAVIASEK